MRVRRSGFTFVELLVVTVLGGVILLATMQILLTNQRTYTAQAAQIQGVQTLRGAVAIVSGELREVSAPLGDIVMMSADSVHVRAQRNVGFICHDTVMGVADFRSIRVGWWLEANDSVFVFADNDSETTTDDAWILTTITSTDTTSTCTGGDPAQVLNFASTTPFSADSVSSGAQVRAFEHIAYGLMQRSGEYYVGRRIGGSWTPLIGPVTSNGISFRYLDDQGNTTTTATDVAQIEVTIRTSADVMDSTGNMVSDSVTIRVETRN